MSSRDASTPMMHSGHCTVQCTLGWSHWADGTSDLRGSCSLTCCLANLGNFEIKCSNGPASALIRLDLVKQWLNREL